MKQRVPSRMFSASGCRQARANGLPRRGVRSTLGEDRRERWRQELEVAGPPAKDSERSES